MDSSTLGTEATTNAVPQSVCLHLGENVGFDELNLELSDIILGEQNA